MSQGHQRTYETDSVESEAETPAVFPANPPIPDPHGAVRGA
jgi:hypothetical protein